MEEPVHLIRMMKLVVARRRRQRLPQQQQHQNPVSVKMSILNHRAFHGPQLENVIRTQHICTANVGRVVDFAVQTTGGKQQLVVFILLKKGVGQEEREKKSHD